MNESGFRVTIQTRLPCGIAGDHVLAGALARHTEIQTGPPALTGRIRGYNGAGDDHRVGVPVVVIQLVVSQVLSVIGITQIAGFEVGREILPESIVEEATDRIEGDGRRICRTGYAELEVVDNR